MPPGSACPSFQIVKNSINVFKGINGVIVLEEELRLALVSATSVRTDQYLMDNFGICYSTFRKIEARQPIRASLAERVKVRLLRPQ